MGSWSCASPQYLSDGVAWVNSQLVEPVGIASVTPENITTLGTTWSLAIIAELPAPCDIPDRAICDQFGWRFDSLPERNCDQPSCGYLWSRYWRNFVSRLTMLSAGLTCNLSLTSIP